jgi:hypothetical protein
MQPPRTRPQRQHDREGGQITIGSGTVVAKSARVRAREERGVRDGAFIVG